MYATHIRMNKTYTYTRGQIHTHHLSNFYSEIWKFYNYLHGGENAKKKVLGLKRANEKINESILRY